ncbi:MAG: hypothetical protein ACPGES_05320 [Coraliomargarita sp.]
MALIIGARILKREFGDAIPEKDLQVLLRSARVALTTPIRREGLPSGTRLLKAYATSSQGPKRIFYLLEVSGGDLLLLFYRGKTDPVGANVTIKNKAFKQALDKHLNLLAEDLAHVEFEVHETSGE